MQYCKLPNVRDFCDGPQIAKVGLSRFKNGRVLLLVRTSREIRNLKCNMSRNGPNLTKWKHLVSRKLGGLQFLTFFFSVFGVTGVFVCCCTTW